MRHTVQWTGAAPLWDEASSSFDQEIRGMVPQPTILRFATDTFMNDYLDLLATAPSRLGELVAQPETWRGPIARVPVAPPEPAAAFARSLARLRTGSRRVSGGSSAGGTATAVLKKADATHALKLYQPAHQRYYLVAACLVCRQAGLPDRAINTAHDERPTFVMRRLLARNASTPVAPDDPGTYDEYAFVTTGEGTGWQKVIRQSAPTPDVLVAGEEQLPLFPASYVQEDGRTRRQYAGLIPVGKREAYLGGAPVPLSSAETIEASSDSAPTVSGKRPMGPREILVRSQVTEPWKQLIARAATMTAVMQASKPADVPADGNQKLITATRELIQTVSWYVLLDFATYLQQYLPNIWAAMSGGALPAGGLSSAETNLLSALQGTTLSQSFVNKLALPPYTGASVKRSLIAALLAAADATVENNLEAVTAPYVRSAPDAKWPAFLFPLADPDTTIQAPQPPLDADPARAVNKLAALVDAALPPDTTSPMPARALGAQPIAGIGEASWFVIRCVYERPRCGPLEPPVVSEPTRAFQLAGFFDPDAPARPIRIALPIDTTPGGLRKFDKNTAFMMSDVLCGQISRMKSLTLGDLVRSVLPWPLHQDLSVAGGGPCKTSDTPALSLGMICSFSIPIITICALILLMIIVSLLDFIFKWMPYFFICFPLPRFKAKET